MSHLPITEIIESEIAKLDANDSFSIHFRKYLEEIKEKIFVAEMQSQSDYQEEIKIALRTGIMIAE